MASRRVLIRDRLNRALYHLEETGVYIKEVRMAFEQFGDYYQKYIKLIDAIETVLAMGYESLEELKNKI